MTTVANKLIEKDVAIFVDASPASDEALDFAACFAASRSSRLVGIFVAQDPSACDCYARGSGAMASMLKTVALREQRRASDYRRRLSEAAARHGATTAFRIVASGADARRRFLSASLLAAVAIASGGSDELPNGWSSEKFMSLSGVPLLIVPPGWKRGSAARRIAIAWNASMQARRAVTAGLPLLRDADAVEIVVVDEDDLPGIELRTYLARHGVRAALQILKPDDRQVASQILAEAERFSADMLIMGAYGHARATRLLFGGTTIRVLRDASVPILMSR